MLFLLKRCLRPVVYVRTICVRQFIVSDVKTLLLIFFSLDILYIYICVYGGPNLVPVRSMYVSFFVFLPFLINSLKINWVFKNDFVAEIRLNRGNWGQLDGEVFQIGNGQIENGFNGRWIIEDGRSEFSGYFFICFDKTGLFENLLGKISGL